jgi:hypothetical protein
MLRGKRFLKYPTRTFSSLKSPTPNSNSNSNSGKGGGLLRFSFLVGTAASLVVGTAYLREHEKIPIEMVNNQLEFLQPIQELLRKVNLGKGNKLSSAGQEEEIDLEAPHYEEEILVEDHAIESESFVEPKFQIDEQHPLVDGELAEEEASGEKQDDSSAEESNAASPVIASQEQNDQILQESVSAILSDALSSSSHEVDSPSPSSSSTLLPEQTTAPLPSSTPAPPSSSTSSSDHFLNLRVATLDNILNDLAKQTTELKQETEQALFHDLESLDQNALRHRILQLSVEYFDRLKWESLRQQQTLRDAEAIFAQKYGQYLSEQQSNLLFDYEKKFYEKERELYNEHERRVTEMTEGYEKRLVEALSNQALKLMNHTKEEKEASEALLTSQLQEEFTHRMALLKQEQMKRSLQAQEAVIEQGVQVKKLMDLVSLEFGKTTVSTNVHGLSAAVFLIETALLSGTPVEREIAALKKHAQGE